MPDVKKSRSFYNLKSKDKAQSDSTEALIPSSSSTVKKSQSNVNLTRPTIAIPPVPEGLPKKLAHDSRMVPGGGTRDMAPPTAPNSPTDYRSDRPSVKTVDRMAAVREQKFPERLEHRLHRENARRSEAEHMAMLSSASLASRPVTTAKAPAQHVHTPRDPSTWTAPGSRQPDLSLQSVERRFPSFKPGKTVNSADPSLNGILARPSGNLDRKGRDVYPDNNKGRTKYNSVANEPASSSKGKSKSGPSVG